MVRLTWFAAILLIACVATALCTGVEDVETETLNEGRIQLPQPDLTGTATLEEALRERRSVRSYTDDPLKPTELSILLWGMQGITDPRGFRTAPSAGALYPLEVTVAIGKVDGIAPGAYRYHPDTHDLEMIHDRDIRSDLAAASLGQQMPAEAPVTFVISGIYERTRGRYGDRAERYTWMEAGHVSQNCYLVAASHGLGTVAIGAFDEAAVQELMGLPGDEIPLYLMPVGRI